MDGLFDSNDDRYAFLLRQRHQRNSNLSKSLKFPFAFHSSRLAFTEYNARLTVLKSCFKNRQTEFLRITILSVVFCRRRRFQLQ